MATQTSKLLLISFILVLVAYLFDIIGFSTTYHTVIDGTSFDVHGGLWKQCVTINDVTTCTDIPSSIEDEGNVDRDSLSTRGIGFNVPIQTGRGCILIHPAQPKGHPSLPRVITVGRKKTKATMFVFNSQPWELPGTIGYDISMERNDYTDWFRSCRALSIIALICFLAGAICTGLKLFALKENKAILIAAICTILTAAICILTSDILLTQNIDDFSFNGFDADYGWSFALTLVGMGIAVIAVVIMIVDLVKGGGNGKVNSNDEEK